MEEGVRYHHKGGMATREKNEWIIDPLYREPITFPFRMTINQRQVEIVPYEKKPDMRNLKSGRPKKIVVPATKKLETMYYKQKMTLMEMATHFKVSTATVSNWLRDSGLKRKYAMAKGK